MNTDSDAATLLSLLSEYDAFLWYLGNHADFDRDEAGDERLFADDETRLKTLVGSIQSTARKVAIQAIRFGLDETSILAAAEAVSRGYGGGDDFQRKLPDAKVAVERVVLRESAGEETNVDATEIAKNGRVRLVSRGIAIDGELVAVKGKGLELLKLLIEQRGEYISMADHGFRTRDVESLPAEVGAIIESNAGAGTRIHPEWFG